MMTLGNNGKPWLNGSGYPDPTAYSAMKRIQNAESEVDNAAHKVVTTIKNILDLSGFELIGRVQIRHKRSGKEFK